METESLQAALFDLAIRELARQHRDTFAPLFTVESWAKWLIWLALNCGCPTDPASLEAFAQALGPALSTRLRRLYFSRELEELNLQVMADPADPQVLLLPMDALGPAVDLERGGLALEQVGLLERVVADRSRWQLLESLLAVPWAPVGS
jgi:hypothetical protein